MGNDTGPTATLNYDCNVANELDLLDFIDNEEEKRNIILQHVLQNVVPHIVWEDGTKGIDIAAIVKEEDGWLTSSSTSAPLPKEDELSLKKVDEQFVTLSEETLFQHNTGSRCS